MTRRLATPHKSSAFFVYWARQPLFWGALLAIIGAVVFLLMNGATVLAHLERLSDAREWIASFGPLAPVAYIILNVAQVVVAPFPGSFMGVAAGYLFGIFLGTLYSVIGLTLGASIAISLGRFLGRPLLVRLFSESQLRDLEGKLRMRSPALWCIVFMFPVPDLLIYMAGMSSVPIRWLLPAIVAGRSIGILMANIVGGWSAHLSPEWLVIKWSIILVLAVVVYVYQRQIRLYTLLGYRRLRRLWRHNVSGSINAATNAVGHFSSNSWASNEEQK